jgi:16S rRNA (cytosine1402-N4)-methyltransferase
MTGRGVRDAGPAPAGFEHEPVMMDEVLASLEPERGGTYLDGTVGGGGHAAALLERAPSVMLWGVDRDPEAVAAARERLARFAERARVIRADFRDLPEALGDEADEVHDLAGVLLDLGVSSHQIDTTARGFSFRPATPLDMRMGGTTGGRRPAADLLNEATEQELGEIFRTYGEVRRWRRLARDVARRRKERPFRTSDDLVDASRSALGTGIGPGTLAQVFQAVRIAVNEELEALERALPRLRDMLASGGRYVVIAYHSLEDRLVKHAFKEWSRECICPPELPVCRCRGKALGHEITRRPLRPSEDEVRRNSRSRSARLRAWEKA